MRVLGGGDSFLKLRASVFFFPISWNPLLCGNKYGEDSGFPHTAVVEAQLLKIKGLHALCQYKVFNHKAAQDVLLRGCSDVHST